MPLTLSLYIGRTMLVWLLITLFGLGLVIFTVDMIELLRRSATRPDVTLPLILHMTLLKLPQIVQMLLPFTLLFASLMTLYRLTRSQELIIARAAGISAWQFLLPLLCVAFALAGLRLAVLNPLAARAIAQYDVMENQYLRQSGNPSSLSKSGLWLRQRDANGYSIIHAARLAPASLELIDVMVLQFDTQNTFVRRLDTNIARLEDGYWLVRSGWLSTPAQPSQKVEAYRLPTDMTREKLQDSFASPQTLTFWELPAFIRVLEEAGFSALRHKMYWQTLLATPLTFAAMVLVAAVFALRIPRRGQILLLMVGGLGVGFLYYFMADLIAALGISGRLPIILAAWTPPVLYVLISTTALLHTEDG